MISAEESRRKVEKKNPYQHLYDNLTPDSLNELIYHATKDIYKERHNKSIPKNLLSLLYPSFFASF
jgi:hypothetical protein